MRLNVLVCFIALFLVIHVATEIVAAPAAEVMEDVEVEDEADEETNEASEDNGVKTAEWSAELNKDKEEKNNNSKLIGMERVSEVNESEEEDDSVNETESKEIASKNEPESEVILNEKGENTKPEDGKKIAIENGGNGAEESEHGSKARFLMFVFKRVMLG